MSESTLPDYLGPAPDHWDVVTFKNAFDDETSGNPSIKQSDYLDEGVLAVVDQGQDAIGGYTDDPGLACSADLPCIVFGDHTRSFKYVDHPFAIGAQGTRVLVPKGGLQPRFAYHYLRQLRLPDSGYSRHYKFLKRESVPVPPPNEQDQIADALDKVEAARAKQCRALTRLDDLLAAVFAKMFGDPAENQKGWQRETVAEIGEVTTGNTPSRNRPEYYGDELEWIKSSNILEGDHLLTEAEERLSPEGVEAGRTVEVGSVLVVCIAGSRSSIGRAALADRTVAFNQQINAITPRADIDPRFLYQQLVAGQRLVQAASTDGMKGIVSKGRLQEVNLMVPPESLQLEFGDVFDRVEVLRQRLLTQGARLDALYASLATRAFRGELTLSESLQD